MLADTKKSKIRNPFPAIGKVFKYEFISTARIFIPVYGALLLLALIIGLLLPVGFEEFFDRAKEELSSNPLEANILINVVKSILMFLFQGLSTAATIITFVLLNKRFKKGMLGDEAYLNMTLPVTVGEHLWGRLLSAICWLLIYSLVGSLCGLLASSRAIPLVISAIGDDLPSLSEILVFFHDETGISLGYGFTTLLVLSFLTMVTAVLFVYFINTFGHLAKKARVLVKLVSIVVIMVFYIRFIPVILYPYFHEIIEIVDGVQVMQMLWIVSAYDILWSAIFMISTHLILTYKLNLE